MLSVVRQQQRRPCRAIFWSVLLALAWQAAALEVLRLHWRQQLPSRRAW